MINECYLIKVHIINLIAAIGDGDSGTMATVSVVKFTTKHDSIKNVLFHI